MTDGQSVAHGQVRNWDAQRQLFVLAFDNGSVEPAFLPQASVKIVDARGTVLDWESFFNYCSSVGIALQVIATDRPRMDLDRDMDMESDCPPDCAGVPLPWIHLDRVSPSVCRETPTTSRRRPRRQRRSPLPSKPLQSCRR